MKLLERMSRRERSATPYLLAEYLLERVRLQHSCWTVAVLWCARGSIYKSIDGTDCWDIDRDARTYPGPHPVIAHPPCGPWGVYRSRCNQSRLDGYCALEHVARWGGVIEHPVGSELFNCANLWPAGEIQRICQCYFGHRALKPTLLYWYPPPLVELWRLAQRSQQPPP